MVTRPPCLSSCYSLVLTPISMCPQSACEDSKLTHLLRIHLDASCFSHNSPIQPATLLLGLTAHTCLPSSLDHWKHKVGTSPFHTPFQTLTRLLSPPFIPISLTPYLILTFGHCTQALDIDHRGLILRSHTSFPLHSKFVKNHFSCVH